jgi:flagellar hook protein FlgE
MSDGSTFARGQILLQAFTNPNALTSSGNNLYSNMANAGPTTSNPSAPGSSSLGTLRTSALESSNVDLTSEMANMIVVERGFQANSKIITTSDEMLQEVINLKR